MNLNNDHISQAIVVINKQTKRHNLIQTKFTMYYLLIKRINDVSFEISCQCTIPTDPTEEMHSILGCQNVA